MEKHRSVILPGKRISISASLKLIVICAGVFFFSSAKAQQSLIQVNGWNAYVHLPSDYNTSKTYPTIIFFPGTGEVGTNASLVIANGPGAYITQGWNGNIVIGIDTAKFIVISLQPPATYPVETTINTEIQTLKSLYKIDPKKLYLTGLSEGGWCASTFVTGDPLGGPYTYASQVAAIVTVEAVKPDDNQPYPYLFQNFAKSGGKDLCFEQALDGRDGQRVVNELDSVVPNSAQFIQTNFGGGGHCCWSSFYGGGGAQPGNFTLGGISQNIYQWLARIAISTSASTPANTAPIVSISPASTGFTDSVKVTLSVTDDKPGSTIYYTTNGTTASTSSTLYAAPFWIKTTSTVNVTAKDADGAMAVTPISATYTKVGNIVVYFENTAGWSQPKVYCWSPTPSSYSSCASWPGTNMTKVSSCGNWWTYTFSGVNGINLIFNDGGSNQTADLNLTAPGIYNYSWNTKAWVTGIPSCNTPPIVSISPASSNFTDSIKVTLSVTDDKAGSNIYYTANGTTASASSTLYTAPFWIKTTTTVNATARDADGAMAVTSVSATYTKTTNIIVYFENTTGWTQPKVYCWSPTPSTYTCTAWPGTNMTKVANCGNWWMYTFSGVSAASLIFDDGSTNQTADLSLTATGTYNYSWATKAWLTGTPACTSALSSVTVYFENSGGWSQPKVYCWSPTPSTYTCASWPGINMSKVPGCGNWWTYTFSGTTATNLIFDDGGSNQTANLYQGSAGIYNYSWNTKAWASGAPVCTGARPSINEEVVNEKFQAGINPNPVLNSELRINVKTNINSAATIKIYDLAGRLIQQGNIESLKQGKNLIQLKLNKISKGYYVALLQQGLYTERIRFIIN